MGLGRTWWSASASGCRRLSPPNWDCCLGTTTNASVTLPALEHGAIQRRRYALTNAARLEGVGGSNNGIEVHAAPERRKDELDTLVSRRHGDVLLRGGSAIEVSGRHAGSSDPAEQRTKVSEVSEGVHVAGDVAYMALVGICATMLPIWTVALRVLGRRRALASACARSGRSV